MGACRSTAVNARLLLVSLVALASAFALLSRPAHAEVSEITVSKEYGIGYLPYMIMEHEKFVEKHAKTSGIGELKVDWQTSADPESLRPRSSPVDSILRRAAYRGS